MLAYAETLTLAPSEVRASDVQALRDHGFSDRAILDIVLMAGLFNLYNRVVDGLGGYTYEGMADEARARGIAAWREDR
jgi:alkylhydroperoxidase family enzyme